MFTAIIAVGAVESDVDYNEYGLCVKLPGKSCRDIYQLNPTSQGKSGYYVVQAGDRPLFVYYDMELECGREKGWMEMTVPLDGERLLVLFQLVELLVIMMGAILFNSQLTKSLTVEYVKW